MPHTDFLQRSDFDYLAYVYMRFWPFWIALEQNIHMGPLAHHSPFKTAASATETECASCIDLGSSYFLIGSGKENQFWIWKRKHVTYIRRGAHVAETWQVWWIVALTSGKNTAAPVNTILSFTQYLTRLYSRPHMKMGIRKARCKPSSPSRSWASHCIPASIYLFTLDNGKA